MPPYERGNVSFVGRDLCVPPLPTGGIEERHRWLRMVTILPVGADAPGGPGLGGIYTYRAFQRDRKRGRYEEGSGVFEGTPAGAGERD